ncbi:hypothetical protein WA171_002736 [Blastocystis sp. BT1]
MVQGSQKDGSKERLRKEKKETTRKKVVNMKKGKKYIAAKHEEVRQEMQLRRSITKVIGQTIEEACASKAVQQEGNKIKLSDLKEKGKNRLNDARQKLREEEKKRKARFSVPEPKKDDWDKEFGDDLLW